MKIAELTLSIDQNGILQIPREAICEMGLKSGDVISAYYLTRDGMENSFQELVLYGDNSKLTNELTQNTIQMPFELMEQANLSEQDDLQIVCLDGALLICRDTAPNTSELAEILAQLTTANGLASALPGDGTSVREQLSQIIKEYEGGQT